MLRANIEGWLQFVGHANAAIGVPLILVGLALMFMGWQFSRTAVPFAYLLLGLAAGQVLVERTSDGLLVGAAIGVPLALISFFCMRCSVATLGGLSGAFVVMGYLSLFPRLNLPQVAAWTIGLFAFIAAAAVAYIMHREMIIVVTSLLGSVLLVSGMDPVLNAVLPRMYNTISAFLADYPGFFVPFVLGGPTLIATLVQMAYSNKQKTGQA